MPTQTAKQEALAAIQGLPDSVALDEIVYRLHTLDKIRRGLQEVEEGRTISAEDLDREIEQW